MMPPSNNAAAIIGSGFPSRLGRAGVAIFEGTNGEPVEARWNLSSTNRLLIEFVDQPGTPDQPSPDRDP